MNQIDIKNLTGKCLVSMPDLNNDFAGTVIYICSHDEHGAMGFIINKILKDLSFQDLTTGLSFDGSGLPSKLHNGGPLEKAKGFILHSSDYLLPDSLDTGNGIAVSSSMEILNDIAAGHGPEKMMITLGYTGWAPQQLESEISDNQWLITEASPELILGNDDDCKWAKALSSLGIKSENLTPSFGHS